MAAIRVTEERAHNRLDRLRWRTGHERWGYEANDLEIGTATHARVFYPVTSVLLCGELR